MAFRTVELTGPAEIHVKNGSLLVEKEVSDSKNMKTGSDKEEKNRVAKGRKTKSKAGKTDIETKKWLIPLEDISSIICMGAGIRISTMAMAQLCNHEISVMMLDENYRPAGMLTAYEANARQSLIMRQQVYTDEERLNKLWRDIILQKISNQAQILHLLSLGGAEELNIFKERILALGKDEFNIDPVEAGAAKLYFHYLSPQLNRREEAPFNSCLNYGYSIIRNTIIRALIAAGLLPAFGIHHKNLFNALILADDLIEPFRPSVDLISYYITGDTIQLDRSQRRKLAEVLLQAVRMNGRKVNIFTAINMMVDDLRSFYCGEKDEIALPDVLPEEKIDMVRE